MGITREPREVSFQVGFVPSITQVRSSPILITEAVLTAVDDFTGKEVGDVEGSRNIQLTTDPYFKREEGEVVK